MSDEDLDVDSAGADPMQEPSEQNKIEAIATVVPVHAVTAIKRKPGRPRKVHPQATVEDLAYHAEIAKKRQSFIEANPVVKAVAGNQDSQEILQKVKEEASRTAAALLFQRIEEEKYGRDTSQISSRHLAALRDVAMLELEMKKMGTSLLDLKSERFQKVFRFLISIIKEVAMEALPPEQANLLFTRLVSRLEGWEDQAESL